MANKTILQIAQAATSRIGLTPMTTLVGNTDVTAVHMLALLKEEVNSLQRKFNWQALHKEVTWTSLAAQLQGTLDTLMPNMKFIVNDTMWNRTLKRPVFGPLSIMNQAQNKAYYQAGPWSEYYIRDNKVYFYPQPVAGQTIYVDYITKAVGLSVALAEITEFTVDTDTPYLDDETLILGLKWRFKEAKGFDYTEARAEYDSCVSDLIGRDGTKQVLDMAGTQYDIMPGIFVPAGSWILP